MIKKGDTIVNIRTGQKMTFLETWAETKGTQLKIDCVGPVNSAREKSHFHPHQENRFTIMAGSLHFTIAGKKQLAAVGDIISIPKNVAHSFHNSGDTDASYIQEFFPALKTDRLFETFFGLARDGKLNKGGAPNIFGAALILLHFNNEIRLAQPHWLLQKIAFNLFAPIAKLMGYKATYE
ncbi:MAG: mannose-6-phosphate isomerase-like protein (cupin superfamily) [Roseivirga sp.]|jgi:mannose-6-phosphate isomerase-like protein (cupin superfamily)